MKLLSMKIINFMPYKDEHYLSFPTSSQQNVMLVFGNNERGKTCILNAIRWCFFGKALGRHLKTIKNLDLVNKNAAKEGIWTTKVELIFQSDGHEYDLRRTLELKLSS